MEAVKPDEQEQEQKQASNVPEPGEYSLTLAQLIEIYIQAKIDNERREAAEFITHLQTQIAELEARMDSLRKMYPDRIIGFADKLARRHKNIPDDVLDKYIQFFGLKMSQDTKSKTEDTMPAN